jgi:methylmalonyl-CoA/ethylmalonyl-CoA epimerase
MVEIKKINHVAIVVEDIDAAMGFWCDSMGIRLSHIQEVPKEKSAVAFLPVGDSEIELVQPISDDSGVAKYLNKRGQGMHHLCLEVQDIEAVLSELGEKGVQLIHETPIIGEGGRKYAFIHPKSATGVLVELYELPGETERIFPVLSTPRLLLRAFEPTDAPAVFEMYTRKDLVQWIEHETMVSIREAEERVSNRISLFEKGWGYRWAVTFKDDPEKVIGSCGYFGVRIGTHTVEMGFDLHPDYWRQGIMTEALTAVLNFTYSEACMMPVHRIEALVDPQNIASINLLSKLGFTTECLRRSFGYWKGGYQDVKMLALLKDQWVKLN